MWEVSETGIDTIFAGQVGDNTICVQNNLLQPYIAYVESTVSSPWGIL